MRGLVFPLICILFPWALCVREEFEETLGAPGLEDAASSLETSASSVGVTERDQKRLDAEAHAAEAQALLLEGAQAVLESIRHTAEVNQLNLGRLEAAHRSLRELLQENASGRLVFEAQAAILAGAGNASAAKTGSSGSGPGSKHEEAKYAMKPSTDGLTGLTDRVHGIEAAQDDAAQRARAVRDSDAPCFSENRGGGFGMWELGMA